MCNEGNKTVGDAIEEHLAFFRNMKKDPYFDAEKLKLWRDAFQAEAYLHEYKWQEIRKGYASILEEENLADQA